MHINGGGGGKEGVLADGKGNKECRAPYWRETEIPVLNFYTAVQQANDKAGGRERE